ncbi:hypothetical protein ACHAXR_004472 [Thalassiosira sp. AJA248-18]
MSRPAMPYSTGAPMLTPAELQKFEAPLIALANLSGGDLRKLFHAFFSFLHRRTDFYCIVPSGAANVGGRMGFQEGQAEQILLASFRQFPLRKVGPKPPSAAAPASAPTAAKKQAPAKKETSPKKTSLEAGKTVTEKTKSNVKDGDSVIIGTDKKDSVDESTKPAATEKAGNTKKDTIRYTEEGKQIPVGNGGSTARYVWTQTLEETTVHIPLPEGLRAKDLDVKIGASSLSIRQKGGASTPFNAIEGTLFGKVRPSESTWTLETTTTLSSQQNITTLQLILDKVQKTWWATVISGDTPLIDTKMVDSTRHIATYDDDTQAQIRRIMHDQRQERLGLPTSQHMELPPMPTGEKVGGVPPLPNGVEFIDGETLDRASISSEK